MSWPSFSGSWILRARRPHPHRRSGAAFARRSREIELAARAAELELKEKLQQTREESDREIRECRRELDRRELDLDEREREAQAAARRQDAREEALLSRENRLATVEETVRGRMRDAEERAREAETRLESLAGLNREAATAQVLRAAEEESRVAAGRLAAQIRQRAIVGSDMQDHCIIGHRGVAAGLLALNRRHVTVVQFRATEGSAY